MIFLAYSIEDQATYAQHNGVVIRLLDSESRSRQDTIQRLIDESLLTTTVEKCQAHHIPEARHVVWTRKAVYNDLKWLDLLAVGQVITPLPK